MVRNFDNELQRKVLVDRYSSSYAVKAQLVTVVHGYKSLGDKILASLIVLEFSFLSLKAARRIKSAKISLRFEGLQEGMDPEISAIAPEGRLQLASPTINETTHFDSGPVMGANFSVPGISLGVGWEKTITRESSAGVMIGRTEIRGRDHGASNTAAWAMIEDQVSQTGVPSLTRTAVLIKRRDANRFLGILEIETDVAGFSFRDFQSGMRESGRDDPVVFDPMMHPMWDNKDFDPKDLGSLNLSDFVSIKPDNPILTTTEDVQRTEQVERENLQTVRELFESVVPKEPPKSSSKNERLELGTSNSFYVELWNMELSSKGWISKVSSNVKNQTYLFPEIPSKMLEGEINQDHLQQYFSWVMEKPQPPPPLPSPGQQQNPPKQTSLCSLIFRKSDKDGFNSFEELNELLGQPHVDNIVEFFKLPQAYEFSRSHDRGSCHLMSSKKDDKPLKAYMIQTPFYGKGGFWSLVLVCMMESATDNSYPSSKISGILQTDNDSDISKIFSGVQKLAKLDRHPMLLPIELFRTHCANTSQRFKALLASIRSVDERLLAELETKKKPKISRKVYRELSRTLHKCAMELEELGHRQTFEVEFGKCINEEVPIASRLKQVVKMFADISKSREFDVNSLPGKIDSQRNVLSGLIAQYDNDISSNLASESLRDSKAMKTLSILTILFLPGAFVATVFSTDMFEFRDNRQEIWIYFVIIVPLTAILMTCWYFWLKKTPYRRDVEAGLTTHKGEAGEGKKGDKSD